MRTEAVPHLRRIAGVLAGALLVALVLMLTAAPAKAATFSDTSAITIPAGAPATTNGPSDPYPSPINVSGLTGTVTEVSVTVTALSHTYPGDIEMVLVGPSGQTVNLLTGVGGNTDIVNVNLTFQDGAPLSVPSPITSGSYRPTVVGITLPLSAPAPAQPYGAALAIFNGTVPNGVWNLFVYDRALGDVGSIGGGWSLSVTTNGPVISSFAPTTAPPGTQVVITGSNLAGATAVLFGGKAASSFTVDSATQITATVPVGATNGPISVTTPAGTGVSVQTFRVSPPPVVSSFSPTTGKAATNVVVTGTDFTGATQVLFGSTPATFTVDSATQITTSVPAGAGTAPISVVGPGGTGMTTQPFVVRHPRSVSIALTARGARGRVTANDTFTKAATGVRVQLQRRVGHSWRTVSTDITNANGRYSFTGQPRGGRYRAVAPKTTLSSGDVCLKAVSSTVRR